MLLNQWMVYKYFFKSCALIFLEEELKRLHKALDPQNSYGQVPFSYENEAEQDESAAPTNKEPNEEAAEEDDEPFIPPQELDIPVGMVLVSL